MSSWGCGRPQVSAPAAGEVHDDRNLSRKLLFFSLWGAPLWTLNGWLTRRVTFVVLEHTHHSMAHLPSLFRDTWRVLSWIVCFHSCFSIPSTLLPYLPSLLRDWWHSPAVTAFSTWKVCLICWCSWIVYWMWHEAFCNAIIPILQWHGLFRQGCISVCYGHSVSYRNFYFPSWGFSDA